jgi:tol-pal system protein YbgF
MSRVQLPILLLMPALVAGCVMDRTGRSGTAMIVRDVQANRVAVDRTRGEIALERGRLDEMDERAALARKNIAQSNATADNLVESIQALAGEFQLLRRQLESSQAFDNDVDYRLSDMEFRLMAIEDQLGIEPPMAPEETEPPVGDPAGGGGAEGEAAAAGEGAGTTAPANPETMAAIDMGALTRDDGPEGAGELDLLAYALQAIQDERHTQAGKALTDFLTRFPGSERAGEARKLLGDTLFSMGKYRDAVRNYETFITDHPDHVLVPEAMYRQGLCFIEMGSAGDLESARVFLDDLIARYPASPEAEKAKRKLEILE